MKKRQVCVAVLTALLFLATVAAGWYFIQSRPSEFQEKAALLKEQALLDWFRDTLDEAPAGEAGSVVFFSVSGGADRAQVWSARGDTLEEAWDAAAALADGALRKSGTQPLWVKADVVYHSEPMALSGLEAALKEAAPQSFHYGAAFDDSFHTALLEAECNANGIYDYDRGSLDLERLNAYLQGSGRETLDALPGECRVFGSAGWLCDEDGQVFQLGLSGVGCGRRAPGLVDGEQAKNLAVSAGRYLADSLREDGSFVYNYDPRSGATDAGYPLLSHAGALLSLLQCHSMDPDSVPRGKIDLALNYLLDHIWYDGEDRAFVFDEENGEVRLGGGALALIALTEYMGCFPDSAYVEDCRALGGGIISMLNPENGTFVHVLNGDMSVKEPFRTTYYDGEAAYALCRLYGLTGEALWLQGAQLAVDHMIEADYTQYGDHWVALTMGEITKYITNRADYYQFALKNAQENLAGIYQKKTVSPADLELLMATFELYDRMTVGGGTVEGFQLPLFLQVAYAQVLRQLDGFFYPEYAMYMAQPQRVAGTFMSRSEGFRVRIDDVQHNIGGCYLYWENYGRLTANGLLEAQN